MHYSTFWLIPVYKDYRVCVCRQGIHVTPTSNSLPVVAESRQITPQPVNLPSLSGTDPERFQHNISDLTRGRVLNLIFVPERHSAYVYLDLRRRDPHFDAEMAADGLLLYMYYLLATLEQRLGDGAWVELVADQMEVTVPSYDPLFLSTPRNGPPGLRLGPPYSVG